MAQIVKLRRSSVAGNKPVNETLQLGELALNTVDGKIYFAVSGSDGPTVQEAITTNAYNTGSVNLSGSLKVVGTEYVTGSVKITGSLFVNGDSSFTSLVVSGSDPVGNVQAYVPPSSVYNPASFNTPERVASGIRFNWNNENWTIGAARGATTDIDGLIFSRNGVKKYMLDEDGNASLSGSMYISGSLFVNGAEVGTGKLNETTFNSYTSSNVSQFAGTSSFALTASYVANPTLVSGSTKKSTVSVGATTWSFNHQLGERYPSINVFDSNGFVVIPKDIETIDSNNLKVYFASNQTGTVIATIGGAGSSGTSGNGTSGTSGTSGSSGTSGVNGSSGTSGVNGSSGTSGGSGSSGSGGTSGSSGTSGRDGIGGTTQTFASSTTWSVAHNLGTNFPAVTVWDDNKNVVIPSQIKSIDTNNIDVYFGSPISGSVNVIFGGHVVSGAIDTSAVGHIVPSVNNTYDLGSASKQFRHLYLSSGSLYIDGQKVLGSSNQELQITTDNGQSLKILEQGTDTITLQSADGDIQLKTSAGGNVLLDPTTGLIDLRGTVQIQDGNKITSSGATKVVFGNDIEVTGSIRTNGTLVVNGVSFSAMTSGTSGSSGSSGSNGSSGTSGTSGSSGTAGTSGSSGVSNSFFNYQAKTVSTSGNPGSGYITWDQSPQTGATFLNISDQETNNNNIDIFIGNLGSGSVITLQDKTNQANYQVWRLGTSVDNTSYYTFPVTLVSATHQFNGNDNILFIITTTPSGTSGSSGTSGTSGTSGSNGSSGSSGSNGSSGSSGSNGSSGTSGSTGTSGSSGSSGTSGSNGSSGSSGTSGSSGSTGTSGSSGSSGTSGSSGSSGTSGSSGSNGSSGSSGTTTITNATDNRVMTSAGGVTLNAEANLTFDGSTLTVAGNVLPEANGTRDLGSSTYRWSTVYTSDLSLNNGIGDWTIVEGEDDLFLYNNKKGKVYKFALTEVDPTVATPKK